jgi:Golgi SNAP receptor complex protein 1
VPAMALGAGWSPSSGNAGWDDLRKQARKLESELDVKLSSFRRLGTAVDAQGDGSEAEIERLLQQLNEVNKHMQNWVSNAGSDVLSHTLARHRNILHELSQEFARIRVNAKASREHAELLQHFSRGDERKNFMDDGGVGIQQQALLREQAGISRSTTQLDSVIGNAQEAYSALRYQRSTFGDISTKINTISTKLPIVNSVLNMIRRRKSRDTLIIGAVASLCTILILLYWLAK